MKLWLKLKLRETMLTQPLCSQKTVRNKPPHPQCCMFQETAYCEKPPPLLKGLRWDLQRTPLLTCEEARHRPTKFSSCHK